MEFDIRRIAKYREVTVKSDETTIALGLHDDEERMALAKTLKDAIRDLLDDDEYQSLIDTE